MKAEPSPSFTSESAESIDLLTEFRKLWYYGWRFEMLSTVDSEKSDVSLTSSEGFAYRLELNGPLQNSNVIISRWDAATQDWKDPVYYFDPGFSLSKARIQAMYLEDLERACA